jgi:tetratricopeptide (TPR) repeat protein
MHYPSDPELLYQAGRIYQQVGRFDEARCALERLVGRTMANGAAQEWTRIAGDPDADESPCYRSVDTGLTTYRGWHELALLHRRMGDAPHCERVLRRIFGEHPHYLPAAWDLAETLEAMGRGAEAEAVRRRLS